MAMASRVSIAWWFQESQDFFPEMKMKIKMKVKVKVKMKMKMKVKIKMKVVMMKCLDG